MSIRRAIERIALADARRFEARLLALQRRILEHCEDAATQRMIEELIADEEDHVRRLDEAASRPESREQAGELPGLRGKTVCEMLREILEMETAAVAFYDLMAKRTAVPVVRDVFRGIAAAERGHEARLADHVREVCGDAAGAS